MSQAKNQTFTTIVTLLTTISKEMKAKKDFPEISIICLKRENRHLTKCELQDLSRWENKIPK
jgi:hypothetical protein